tara:strand:- start:244 stop:834 length:591 start_codon:yes stop_codon:yes gene_type:complete
MNKKTVIQALFFLIIISLCLFLFKSYFDNKKIKTQSSKSLIQDVNKLADEDKPNLMHKIKYTSKEILGDIYIVDAEEGYIKSDDLETIIMKGVSAKIKIKNSSSIIVLADHAIYNKDTYNTNFYENIIMTYENSIINCDKFDLDFDKKIAILSDNIIYKNLNTKMIADKIELNLITKELKIFMNDKKKKVKLIKIN